MVDSPEEVGAASIPEAEMKVKYSQKKIMKPVATGVHGQV